MADAPKYRSFYDHFVGALSRMHRDGPVARPGGREWTRLLTGAIVDAAQAVFREQFPNCQTAARGHKTQRGRSEHLSLDVVLYECPLGPLCFAAEHENTPRADIIQYQAWKLLNVRAECRVLVAYWSNKRPGMLRTFADVVAAIQDVAVKQRSGELLAIAGDRDVESFSSSDFAKFFQCELTLA